MSVPGSSSRSHVKPLYLLLLAAAASFAPTAKAQDATKALPKNYSPLLDNKDVTVIRAHYGPHEKIAVHDHSNYATVYVYLSDSGPVRIDHIDKKPYSITRPPTTNTAFRVAGARPERHSVQNLGDQASDFLRIEIKRSDLEIPEPVRGKAPATLSAPKDAVEFRNAGLQIERIICEPLAPCVLSPASENSLIIAFTPFEMSPDSSATKEKLKAGEVRWMPPSGTLRIVADSNSPTHLLRILVPNAQN